MYFNQSSDNRDITSGTMSMDYCCVPSNVEMGDNSITNEPGFVSRAAVDYRLASVSACVDAGFEFPWMSSAEDLDGQPRVAGATVDIGAYERQ